MKKLWKARFPERLKMLIWRIGINAISPPELIYNEGSNMLIRLTFFVTHVLKQVSTSSLNATFARTLWSSAFWGFRIDASLLNSNEDIIKLIMAPPNSPMPIWEQWTISLNMAIIIDEIWKTRNLMLF